MAWEENSRICLHMQLIAILSRIGVYSVILLCALKQFKIPIKYSQITCYNALLTISDNVFLD